MHGRSVVIGNAFFPITLEDSQITNFKHVRSIQNVLFPSLDNSNIKNKKKGNWKGLCLWVNFLVRQCWHIIYT